MDKGSNISKELSIEEQLESKLNLKQLQINRLLNITQAINSNVSGEGLYNMYSSFLSWEMGVRKMLLYFKCTVGWDLVSFIGVEEERTKDDITHMFERFDRTGNIEEPDHPLLKEFDIVVPVKHKESEIALVFIGGFEEDEEMYNKVQFITTITNIIAVAIENKRLFKKQVDQEKLKREMELASEMQLMLVPSILPSGNSYELASIYKPQIGVGGDYFDYIDFGNSSFAFCVADIAGKGIAAALLMANFQANLHSLIRHKESLSEFIHELNNSVYRITKGERYITFFIAEFNEETRKLRYINAGHNRPYLFLDGQLYRLDKGSTFLGSFKQIPSAIEVGEFDIPEDAMILSYTDGLSDLKNESGEYMSEELIQNFVLKNHELSARKFNASLLHTIEEFIGEGIYPDDLTVLTCKIFGKKEKKG